MNTNEVEVKILTEYTPEVARGLGRLTPFLSEAGTGKPVPEVQLRKIIEANDHVQFIALLDNQIVGAATLVEIRGILREKAYLQDFVTDAAVRGKGVGHKLWVAIESWCMDHGITTMDFTSRYDRPAAHDFFIKHGAKIRDVTAPFRVVFNGKVIKKIWS